MIFDQLQSIACPKNEIGERHGFGRAVPWIAWMIVCVFPLGSSRVYSQVAESADSQDSVESLWTGEGEDWPRIFGPRDDGTSSEEGILRDWRGGKLRVRWTIETGEGYGMGAVAKGRYFHFGKYDDRAVLKCLNAESGKLLWQFPYQSDYQDIYGYDSGPRASPVIDGDRVYIYGVEGLLHCLKVTDGSLIWKVDTAKEYDVVQNFFGVGSTPLVYEDLLLVMVGGSPKESLTLAPGDLGKVKSNGSGIVAFDKKTGKEIYRSIDDLASYSSLRMMELDGKPVCLAWMRESLHGFDPKTGKQGFAFPWRARKLESVNAATPVVIGSKLLVTECYQNGSALIDVSGKEPEIIWSDRGKRAQALAAHWNTPIVSGDYLYGCSGRHSGSAMLRCVNWKTGEIQWSQGGLGHASMTKIDGHFVLLGEMGQLLLIKEDPERFNVVTQFESVEGNELKLRPPCWAAPVIAHGFVWVRGKNTLACLELRPK